MTWVRIDEEFAHHPKVLAAGPLGMAMQVAALCYCNRYLTDGFVPHAAVPTLLDLRGLGMRIWSGELIGGGEDAEVPLIVEDLVNAGLWDEVSGGYRIHDYHDYQPSKVDVLALREKRKDAGRKGGQAKAKASAKQDAGKRSSTTEAKTYPGSDPVPDSFNQEPQSPNGLSAKRKQSKSQEIANRYIAKAREGFSQGVESQVQLFEVAFKKAWADAGKDSEGKPLDAGKSVLAAFFEDLTDRKPTSEDWGKLGFLVKEHGHRAFEGLELGLAKAPDDWLPYARGVCKKSLERAP